MIFDKKFIAVYAKFKKEYQIKKKYAHPLKMFQIYI